MGIPGHFPEMLVWIKEVACVPAPEGIVGRLDDAGACGDAECTIQAEKKRYLGWGALGLIAGIVAGRTVFAKHPYVSAAAGLAGGVAWAGNESVNKCAHGTFPAA